MNQRRPRDRNETHLAFIRELPCLVCGNPIETEAAHIRFGCFEVVKPKAGIGEKPDDMWTVPLCGKCHRQQHEGNEQSFWEAVGVNPVLIALRLFSVSGDYERGMQIVAANCEHVAA